MHDAFPDSRATLRRRPSPARGAEIRTNLISIATQPANHSE